MNDTTFVEGSILVAESKGRRSERAAAVTEVREVTGVQAPQQHAEEGQENGALLYYPSFRGRGDTQEIKLIEDNRR